MTKLILGKNGVKAMMITRKTVNGALLSLSLSVFFSLLSLGFSQNHLAGEQSPYLLQHADNPVDWYPWGQEAFDKAIAENKPIFLSIGYSTCHWCHVMEEESFEDEDVATLLNATFISVKVDREERPDIDKVYMNIANLMNGGGGWPLNIIMTPDKKPFYAATYLPKNERFGRIGMLQLLPSVHQLWLNDPEQALKYADNVVTQFQANTQQSSNETLNAFSLADAYEQLSSTFDDVYGGFGTAPKFPRPHDYLYLLKDFKRNDNQRSLDIVLQSLESMRQGGIYDQLGFGFYRYSTDQAWLTPHFEKMLYDQAMLSMAFTDAYLASGQESLATTVNEVLSYVLRDMTSEEGGFYSAEDADSEGEEGKFYLWTVAELSELLSPEDLDFVVTLLNLSEEGNFREASSPEVVGRNILHTLQPLSSLNEEDNRRWNLLRQYLYEAREARVKPFKDDKILTDWNGLMIAAMAKAGRALDNERYTAAAVKAADFLLDTMYTDDGRLLHRYRQGEAGIDATTEDYAYFIWGLLELYESTFDPRYLEAATSLQNNHLERFWDEAHGGFYFTANDAEVLLTRSKDIYDAAIPSGNSVAMLNLLRLGRLLANADYEAYAQELGDSFASDVKRYAAAYTQLMSALDFAIGPSFEVVIAGDLEREDTQAMLNALHQSYTPNKVVLLRQPDDNDPIINLAEYSKYYVMQNDQATAYVCLNYFCQNPTNDPEVMLSLINDFELPNETGE